MLSYDMHGERTRALCVVRVLSLPKE